VFYNAEGFKRVLYKIKAFYDQYLKAIGPSVNLQYWIDCYLQSNELEDCTDDNS
jgi:hypothetical protein